MVCGGEAFAQVVLVTPPELVQAAHIDEFAWRAIGFAGIEVQFSVGMNHIADYFRQRSDGHFFARTNVNGFRVVIMPQEK